MTAFTLEWVAVLRGIRSRRKVNLVRYADDFIITGVSQALLEEEVKPLVVQFLKERGLELAEEKTRIVHIDQGFDFLGFNVRKYNGKLLIKPATSSIAAVKEKVREIIGTGKSLPQGILIRRLNPVIRGWGNYYRHFVSKEVFHDIDNAIWRMTWNWAKRRHPQRARRWVKDRYYARREGCNWVFTDGSVDLFRMLSIPIRRHVLIRGASNPYDPAHASYFAARRARQRNEAPENAPVWLFLCRVLATAPLTIGCFTAPYQGLSPVQGNLHAGFLGGRVTVTSPGYPTSAQRRH